MSIKIYSMSEISASFFNFGCNFKPSCSESQINVIISINVQLSTTALFLCTCQAPHPCVIVMTTTALALLFNVRTWRVTVMSLTFIHLFSPDLMCLHALQKCKEVAGEVNEWEERR